jgi:phosphodiesterase/alkaline phosphatase D-like protein
VGFASRVALALTASLAVAASLTLAAAPDGAHAAQGFQHGVAAGEVRAHSAHIWTRSNTAGRVRAQVATDPRFRNVVARVTRRAQRARDLTVQAVVRGLRANTVHHYRWCAGRGARRTCSRGQFRTAPRPNQSRPISFAYTGDTEGIRMPGADEPFFGTFEVFRSMHREGNDFNVHLGDTMYSDTQCIPCAEAGDRPALSVRAKWRKYKENLEQPNLRRIRASAGFYSHWDDHEFINDFSIPEHGRALYRRSVKAFRDYAPVTYTPRDGIYRSFRWGRHAELFFLDMRSFRSAKASAGGTCDNPQTDSPDFGPTAPQNVRDAFSALSPSLAEPVSDVCKFRINTPDRTMLGDRQRARFLRDLERSDARWKIVLNQLPMQQLYALPYDAWEGYGFERMRILNQLERRGIDRVVFLTADQHAAYANVIRKRTLPGDVAPPNTPAGEPPIDTRYHDFVIGPVAVETDWEQIDRVTGRAGNGQLIASAFYKPDPPNGVGMLCAQGDQYSYAQVSVTRSSVTVAYKDENGDQLLDVDGTPCGPYRLTR